MIENFGIMGIPIPPAVKDTFAAIKSKAKKSNNRKSPLTKPENRAILKLSVVYGARISVCRGRIG